MTGVAGLPDLAARRLGGGVVACSDEFFAAADNLLNDGPPGFRAGVFGPKGQVYDGWETRRRRGGPGHDWAVVRLGVPGVVRGVVVDTAHFTGNFPPFASVDGACVDGYPAAADLAAAAWLPLVPRSPLAGDARHAFDVDCPHRITHVRLNIHPDGGVARLRVPGEALPDPALLPSVLDLAAAEHGGRVVACSDAFYGAPGNLLAPGPARVMGEGWETARRRGGGNDWVVVRLAGPGAVELVELDTSHFKGNAPERAWLRGGDSPEGPWRDLLPPAPLRPDTRHRYRLRGEPVPAYARLDVYPDGGLARLRLWGRLAPEALAELTDRWRGAFPPERPG